MASTTTKLTMKLLIDPKGRRVLFAEASKEVVDFLFSILSLPLSTLIRLLSKEGMEGSLVNLYKSVTDFSDTYLQPNLNKDTILLPKLANPLPDFPLLLPATSPPETTTKLSYVCAHGLPSTYVSDGAGAICSYCRKQMTQVAYYVEPPKKQPSTVEVGYVKGLVTYMVMDNLVVKPISTISSITMLKDEFDVKDLGALQEKVVNLTIVEGTKLLKASLYSNTVLTDVFITGKKKRAI